MPGSRSSTLGRGPSRSPEPKSSYRERLRTLYNRSPSKSSTHDTVQRRRSKIQNRDLDDKFGRRLTTDLKKGGALKKNGSRSKTGLPKLGGSRPRYKLPGAPNSGRSGSSIPGVRTRSSSRTAAGVNNLRDPRSTRTGGSIRHVPGSRLPGGSRHNGGGLHRPRTLAGANHHFHGGHHSSISLFLGFGSYYSNWGLYAFPYHYSYYLPYSYYDGYGYDAPAYYAPSYLSYPSSSVVYGVDVDTPTEKTTEDSEEASLARLAQQHLDLGDFYFKQGRFKEAAESYMRALAYAPDDGAIHFVIADALFAQGDYHYAAFMISKGLELDPELAYAEADKRGFYEDPAIFDRQMETLRSYLEDKPYDAAVHMVLGYNLRYSGDRSAARPPLERTLEIDPGNRAAKILLDALDGEVKPGGETAPKIGGTGPDPVKKAH